MFVSDYTVRALTDVTYLRVSRFLYQAARSATLLERAQITSDSNNRAATAANGRLSFDSAITAATVDSSLQLTPTSSFSCPSIVDVNTRSIVDATVLASHLEQQQQNNQESKTSTCSGDTIHM
jgi:hypothetical protein